MQCQTNDITYTLERKSVKNINLRIRKDGSVYVSAPKRCALKHIQEFIKQKEEWIIKTQQKVKKAAEINKLPCIYTKQQAMQIFEPISLQCYEALKHELKHDKPPTLKIRDMKTCWGVCRPLSNQITLNLRLAQKPIQAIQYVIMHEYAHFFVNGHGKNFWATLQKYMPDYKQRKLLLKVNENIISNINKNEQSESAI